MATNEILVQHSKQILHIKLFPNLLLLYYRQELLKLVSQRRGKLHGLLCARVTKSKLRGVEKLSSELANLRLQLWVRHDIVPAGSIDLITNHRMFHPGEVNANLMSSAGLDLNV